MLLWHYTTQNGLLGILQSGKFWASHIAYLNDSRELHYAVDLFSTVLDEHVKKTGIKPEYPKMVQGYIGYIAKMTGQLGGPFVVSFSLKENDLSQWRAYSGSGVGYALGFEPDHFPETSEQWPMRLDKCIYQATDQTSKLESLAETLDLSTPPKIEHG